MNYNFETGSGAIRDLIAEHYQFLQWDSHNALPLLISNVSHDSAVGMTSTNDVVLGGGAVDALIENSTFAGNLDASNFNTPLGGLVLNNIRFHFGTFIPPATPRYVYTSGQHGYYAGVMDDPDASAFGVTSMNRILAVGSTLGSELVTDGNAEAAGMAAWTSAGTSTTAEKNATTPIGGTQDIHIVTDGVASA